MILSLRSPYRSFSDHNCKKDGEPELVPEECGDVHTWQVRAPEGLFFKSVKIMFWKEGILNRKNCDALLSAIQNTEEEIAQ